ncbi:MAG: cytochrome c [Bacteroidales bacterium]|nr:cytochrome c [Bacteroidales bacterium]
MKKLPYLLAIVMMAFVLMSFMQDEKEGKEPWDIPDEYKEMENPHSVGDKEMEMVGQSLFNRNCKSCHGRNGEGDGPMARRLDAPMDDFTSCDFQNQDDGTIYYQSIIGRDEMPNYEKKIPNEEDRWALITYIRTLKDCDE